MIDPQDSTPVPGGDRLGRIEQILGSAARHAESATQLAQQNAIAVRDFRQDMQLAEDRRRRDAESAREQMDRLGQQLGEHVANSEATRQKLDNFIHEAQRLMGDQGGRLSRVEAALESLVSLSQSHERRLTGNESRFLAAEDRISRTESNIQQLSSDVRSLTAAVERLEAIMENHLRREHGQGSDGT